MINCEACEVSFDINNSIEVRGEGGSIIEVTEVLFKKPTRSSGPIFQKMVSMINRGMISSMAIMESVANKDEVAKAKKNAEGSLVEEQNKPLIQSIEEMTEESLLEEVEGIEMLFSTMDIDFEALDKLFSRMLFGGQVRSSIASIGGVPMTEAMLDKMDYSDYVKMIAVYFSFFGKPAKSGTKKG